MEGHWFLLICVGIEVLSVYGANYENYGNYDQYAYDQQKDNYDYGDTEIQQNAVGRDPAYNYGNNYNYQYNYGDGAIKGKENSYTPKPAEKKVFVPVIVKKKKKKQKILTIQKGVFIPGGTQVFGKFKSLKGCMKACGATATCFSGDYNPWLGKCYFHSNTTACDNLQSHKKITHFKKVPCTVTDAPRGIVVLGAHLSGGILQKGIDDLVTCSKKCATAGGGIAASTMRLNIVTATANKNFLHNQLCFGIDYNFATHECYFHTNLFSRPAGVPVTPTYGGFPLCPVATGFGIAPDVDLAQNPSTVHMLFCPND